MNPIQSFINGEFFRIPGKVILYSPQHFCSFSIQGEAMVNALVELAPYFHKMFNSLIAPYDQSTIAMAAFMNLSGQFKKDQDIIHKREDADPELKANNDLKQKVANLNPDESLPDEDEPGKKKRKGTKFYEQKRKYEFLVPKGYKRTAAPRLTATGTSLHGMKKDLTKEVVRLVLKYFKGKGLKVTIIDIDMSAAHARFAVALQRIKGSNLYQAVTAAGKFWDDKAEYYYAKAQKLNIALSKLQIRNMLKIFLYTSLNGGNPVSREQMFSTLTKQEFPGINSFKSITEFETSDLFKTVCNLFADFELIEEVKELNKSCTTEDQKATWTVDRTKPYEIDSPHKGISRALQGFEVILLTVLTRSVLKRNGLPLNLAHDGLMVLFPGEIDGVQLCKELSEEIEPWSLFLMEGLSLPVEPKFCFSTSTIKTE